MRAGGIPAVWLAIGLSGGAAAEQPDAAALAEAAPAVLSAERITLDADRAVAEGEVQASWGPWSLTAGSLTWERASGRVVAMDGALPSQGLRFGAATLELETDTLSLSEAQLDRPGLHLRADALDWDRARFTFADARLTLCDCGAPPWSLELRQGAVSPTGWARGRGAWLWIGPRRVLPLPWVAAPVGRVVHPLAPRLGWTDDGASAALPIWAPLGPRASLIVAPEWRQDRGVRGLVSLETPAGSAQGALGWDTLAGALRGDASGALGRAEPTWRAAVTAQLSSDADYLSDYGDTLLERSVPWFEQRALAGRGPARGELFAWQRDDQRGVRPSLVLQRAVQPLGALRLGGTGRLDAVDGVSRVEGALSLDHSGALGPLELNSALLGRALGYGGETPSSAADGLASLSALLPMWADHGGWRNELALGATGAAGGRAGGVLERLPADAGPAPWSAGPVLESRWWSARGYGSLRGSAPWTPDGPSASARGRIGAGPWSAALQADALQADALRADLSPVGDVIPPLYGGELAYRDEVWAVWLSAWVLRGELPADQGRAGLAVRLPGGAGAWRPELEALASTAALQELRLGLGWSSGCGCLGVTGRAAFAVDRRWPQLGLELRLSP